MKKVFLTSLLILCFLLASCGGEADDSKEVSAPVTTDAVEVTEATTVEVVPETSEMIEEPTIENKILAFVESFNASSETHLVFAEDFIPSDKSGSHYRTEFRLSAYSDAIGKSYTYGDTVVDLVGRQDWSGNIILRVYMDSATIEQCVEMVTYASPIMDPEIDATELQNTIDYVAENKTANGYYYANLGLLLLGNDAKGYEFMLKMGND